MGKGSRDDVGKSKGRGSSGRAAMDPLNVIPHHLHTCIKST